MSTQTINAAVYASGSNGQQTRGRLFTDSSTDGQFDGNNMLSTVGSGELGQILKGQTVTHVCLAYTAGCAAWKIMDRTTQAIKRYGLGVKAGQVEIQDCAIPPYTVQESDILVIFPLAV